MRNYITFQSCDRKSGLFIYNRILCCSSIQLEIYDACWDDAGHGCDVNVRSGIDIQFCNKQTKPCKLLWRTLLRSRLVICGCCFYVLNDANRENAGFRDKCRESGEFGKCG